MKKTAAIATAFVAIAASAPSHSQPASPPEIKFEAKSFLQLPKGMYVGEVSGVAVNKLGHVFVFQRGDTSGPAYSAAAAQLLEFDKTGKFVREIGKHLYAWSFAHDVRVDPKGNIWAADKGSDMVIRFNPAGRVTWVFGRKAEAADEGAHPLAHPNPPLPAIDGYFRQVTDMAWDSKGDTYISDGYINSRVAKIGPDGQWLKQWGSFGSGPGQFNTVHAIATDAQDRVYVADRGNRRIQVFDTDGNLLKTITVNVPFPHDAPPAIGNHAQLQADGFTIAGANQTQGPGAPWTLCITPPDAHGKQVLYTSDSWPGRIYKLDLDGHVLGWLGGSGKNIGQFGWIHEIACPSENELYVAELLNWRVQKLTLHP